MINGVGAVSAQGILLAFGFVLFVWFSMMGTWVYLR